MKINYDKTVVYRLGSARKTMAKFYSEKPLIWSDNPIKILGVILTDNEHDLLHLNYEPLLQKVDAIFEMWRFRGLSLQGKILVTNALIISLFTYKFSVLPPMPKD